LKPRAHSKICRHCGHEVKPLAAEGGERWPVCCPNRACKRRQWERPASEVRRGRPPLTAAQRAARLRAQAEALEKGE
jgi:hypothetical protein